MEKMRGILIAVFALSTYFLFINWQEEHGSKPAPHSSAPEVTTVAETAAIPSIEQRKNEPASIPDVGVSAPQAAKVTPATRRLIRVKTDVLNLKIDPVGGNIVSVSLLKYPFSKAQPERPEQILMRNAKRTYVAQSGLMGQGTPDAGKAQTFVVSKARYVLADNADVLEIPLKWVNAQGIEFKKVFRLRRGSYSIDLNYSVTNRSDKTFNTRLYTQLKRDKLHNPEDKQGLGSRSYMGAAYSSAEQRYEKYSFSDIEDKPLKISTPHGWIAFLQHYFVAAWVPQDKGSNTIYSIDREKHIIVGMYQPPVSIRAGAQRELKAVLYVGPKIQKQLAAVAPHLELTVDYGILWWIGQPIFWLLSLWHSLIGNWGLAIILVTVAVKLLLFPLSNVQYRSFAKMRKLQPKLAALKERFGDDKQKMSKAMMELYRKEKVNPLGGCFPLLLQMPVFYALYWVLLESVELRQAPFILWIQDLSLQDPFYILPLLMGVSMFLMQKMQPTAHNMDPMQQKLMRFMPVLMTVFFLFFPAGLVLYWLTNNLLSISQQVVVTKMIDREDERKAMAAKN